MTDVVLLAHSIVSDEALSEFDKDCGGTSDSDHLAEWAGRICYQSFDRPNPATESNADYLANIIRQRHFSVLAHASFTFRFTDVSRTLTHELIRHRFLAFSELSQRYVNMNESYTVVPPLFRGDVEAENAIRLNHDRALAAYDDLFVRAMVKLEDQGVTGTAARKQARQAARYVIPGGCDTRIVVSGNVRAWRDFISQRNTLGADAEIREVAQKVLAVLHEYAPNSVADLVDAADPGLRFNELFDNVPTEGQVLEDA